MLAPTFIVLLIALGLFTWLGLQASRTGAGLDDYVTARNSQGAGALGLSFLASGMGGWILFAPPEVAVLAGPVALAGYAIGAALPFLAFSLLGPRVRLALPEGRSIGEFAGRCFGPGTRRYIALVSLLYMLCFLTAELTAIGAITTLLSDLNGNLAILAVACATLIYTTWGGLRASLVTDQWQGGLLVVLLLVVGFYTVNQPPPPGPGGRLPEVPTINALSIAVTLVIAVTAANLFHQGYWQRLWAARNGASLGKGALVGAVTTIAIVALVGSLGILAVSRGVDPGQPPIPFFALMSSAPIWLTIPALVLGLTLVASSVDTLQNALASLAVTETPGLTLGTARWLTVLLMVPVVLVALQGISVLRLFLIADLLCATAVVPVLLGLWSRMSASAAISGCVAGVIGAILPGWLGFGSLVAGLEAASFPGGVPTLAPFAGALIGSAVISLLVAGLTKRGTVRT